MANVSDPSIEQKCIALLMQSPTHIKALDLDLNLFMFTEYKEIASIFKNYIKKYHEPPTYDTIKTFCNGYINEQNTESIIKSLELIQSLPNVDKSEAVYFFDKLNEYKIGRDIYDFSEFLNKEFTNSDDYYNLRNSLIKKLLDMKKNEDDVHRGKVFNKEAAISSVKRYVNKLNGSDTSIILFGIPSLDEGVGGMKKSHLTLVYSNTGGGKTIFAISSAYNAMMAGHNVLYITIEMDYDSIQNKFQSRKALLDSKKIIFGKLSKEEFEVYKQKVTEQARDKRDLDISDIKRDSTIVRIHTEIENYRNTNGVSPDLVVIDYADLVSPVEKSYNTSSQRGNVLRELKECAKYYNCAILTMTQESRTATMDFTKAKNKQDAIDNDGVHNIGQSNYMAVHCENVLHLIQSPVEKAANKVWLNVNKSRFGGGSKKILLNCFFNLTYIGENKLNG